MILAKLINLYEIVLIARMIITWIPHNPSNQAVQFLYKITEPVLAPVRKVIPPIGGMDFSPIVVFIGLGLLKRMFH